VSTALPHDITDASDRPAATTETCIRSTIRAVRGYGPLHTGLTGFLTASLAVSVCATPVGILDHAAFDPTVVGIESPAISPPTLPSDHRYLSSEPDPNQTALTYSPFDGSQLSSTGLLNHVSPSFTVRPIVDLHLTTTISGDGRLSISSGGDEFSGRGATLFGTGEARRVPTAPTYGAFAVLVQLEPADGFLSGPFVNEATFSELYSALEQYHRQAVRQAMKDSSGSIAGHATFP